MGSWSWSMGHNLLRTDCNLVLLSWTSGIADCVQAAKATCAWIWQFTLGGIWCTNKRHAIWCCLSRAWHCCGWYAAMTYLYGYDSSGLGDIGCTGFSSCCKASRGGQQRLLWRQPLASDSQALVPEMTNLHHPIGRATDIRTPQVIYRACQCRVHTLRSFICDHVGEPTHSDGPLTPICGGGWIYNFSIVGKKGSFIDGVV